jgi:hypothetical protein
LEFEDLGIGGDWGVRGRRSPNTGPIELTRDQLGT